VIAKQIARAELKVQKMTQASPLLTPTRERRSLQPPSP
jgi:hypothetical protein